MARSTDKRINPATGLPTKKKITAAERAIRKNAASARQAQVERDREQGIVHRSPSANRKKRKHGRR